MLIKVGFDEDHRRFSFPDEGSFESLKKVIRSLYDLPEDMFLRVRYRDDEEEYCTIANDSSFNLAKQETRGRDNVLRLHIQIYSTTSNGILRSSLSLQAATALLEQPNMKEFISGIVMEFTQTPQFRTVVEQMVPVITRQLQQQETLAVPPSDPQFSHNMFQQITPFSSVMTSPLFLQTLSNVMATSKLPENDMLAALSEENVSVSPVQSRNSEREEREESPTRMKSSGAALHLLSTSSREENGGTPLSASDDFVVLDMLRKGLRQRSADDSGNGAPTTLRPR